MPLIYRRKNAPSTRSLWHLVEPEAFFASTREQYRREIGQETGRNPIRTRQWLCARHVAHHIHGVGDNLRKTQEGRPILADFSRHISISHSHEMVAFLTSEVPCGIDVEKITERLSGIASKFVSEGECGGDVLSLHLVWCAKESMYKAYGLRGLNFKEDLRVCTPEVLRAPSGVVAGILNKGSLTINYQLTYEIWNQYFLVVAEEQSRDMA